MSEKSTKCVICGRLSIIVTKNPSFAENSTKSDDETNKYETIFSNWKNECSRTLCELLFGGENQLFLYYFQQNDAYCSVCQQISRDINFTWRQIVSLQTQLNKLSTTIRKRLHGNYLNIERINIRNEIDTEENIQSLESQMIIQYLLNDETEDHLFQQWTYSEAVTVLYKAASRVCEMTWPMSPDLFGPSDHVNENNNSVVELQLEKELNTKDLVNINFDMNEMLDSNLLDENFDDDWVGSDDGTSELGTPRRETNTVINNIKPKGKAASNAEFKLTENIDVSYKEGDNYLRRQPDKKQISDDTDVDDYEDDSDAIQENFEDNDDNSDAKSESTGDDDDPMSENDRKENTNKGNIKIKPRRPLPNKLVLVRARKTSWVQKWRQNTERKNCVRKRKLKCTVQNCEAKFKSEEAKQIHIIEEHTDEQKPFECSKCLKRFKRHCTLQKHLKDLHSGSRAYDHNCKYCGKGYSEENELLSHYSSSHLGANPFSCAFCDKMYSNTSDLRMHMQGVHPEDDKPKCNVCGKYFATKLTLEVHSLLHGDPDLLFKCPMCSHVSATSARLKDHMARHDKEKKFTCEFCGKSFNHRAGLHCHMSIHTEEKKYKCKICGRAFAKSTGVKRHEVTHTGVKDHVCDVCGRAFATRYNLTDHEKIHLREKGIPIPTRSNNKTPKQAARAKKKVDPAIEIETEAMVNSIMTEVKQLQEKNVIATLDVYSPLANQQLQNSCDNLLEIDDNDMLPLPPLSSFNFDRQFSYLDPSLFSSPSFCPIDMKEFTNSFLNITFEDDLV